MPALSNHAPSLSGMFTPPLVITAPDGTDVTIPPPPKEDGLILTAIYTQLARSALDGDPSDVCPTCGTPLAVATNPDLQHVIDTETRDIEEIALSKPIYDQLIAGGINGDDLHVMGFYAFMFWVAGKSAADNWVETRVGIPAEKAGMRPKGSKRSKNGRPTG
ncbi:hypothetical protein [Actinobaculum sp. 352]|uniref:DUF7426 family protein n=1 Tax=Actinobaculum sp. 352 TaxID=2490946 RepID=UPI000F7F11D4|nr:hypothetical protein [Actinobaculum sp. 352]RTE47890.1 hypothetical protein EKN07_11565 [Actinobaculum sp. 352]